MKTLLIIGLLSSPVLPSCPAGSTEWEGNCAADIAPSKADPSIEPKPSSENPPHNQQPAWETGDVKADMPASQASNDANMDKEKDKADAIGKKAAGL